MIQIGKFSIGRVENIVEKEENDGSPISKALFFTDFETLHSVLKLTLYSIDTHFNPLHLPIK